MSKIDYQALREIAKQATQGEWVAFISSGTGTYAVHTPGDKRCEDVIKWTGFDGQNNAENNARYIAAFNPEVVQALLDERERNQQYIKSRDQENEDIALTVGKLRVELGAAKKRIAELETKANQQTRISDKGLTKLIADADKMLGMRSPVVDSEWWTLLRQFLIELQDRRKNSISESGIRAETLNDLIRHIDRNVDIDAMKSPFELSSEIVDYVNKQLHKESA
ncbi:ead/Ea22-like family protein [Escherichia coli]|uniref:ead/Ea22-like family protein n=1 Tax=Escherichia coli TaxID=562 RepID=UPI0028E12C3A|nr:ead/Ea22-like family protein [Escherichia coli]MDT9460504.1 ead/Ea22-like family protein [Escherichia coli]